MTDRNWATERSSVNEYQAYLRHVDSTLQRRSLSGSVLELLCVNWYRKLCCPDRPYYCWTELNWCRPWPRCAIPARQKGMVGENASWNKFLVAALGPGAECRPSGQWVRRRLMLASYTVDTESSAVRWLMNKPMIMSWRSNGEQW